MVLGSKTMVRILWLGGPWSAEAMWSGSEREQCTEAVCERGSASGELLGVGSIGWQACNSEKELG